MAAVARGLLLSQSARGGMTRGARPVATLGMGSRLQEQPALCLRGFPRRPRVALSRVSDPPGLGRRYLREPWGRLGGRYTKTLQSVRPRRVHHTVRCILPRFLFRSNCVLHQSSFAWDLAFRLRTGPCKIKCPSPPFTLPSEWSARGSAAAPAPVDNKLKVSFINNRI